MLVADEAVQEGGNAQTAARPARRLPRHIFSHGPAALTARGAPVQIWQPWEVSASLCTSTHSVCLRLTDWTCNEHSLKCLFWYSSMAITLNVFRLLLSMPTLLANHNHETMIMKP
jgi:hypothetical protein